MRAGSLSLALIALPFALGALICRAAAGTSAPRPNVLVIYSDDHGWADLGCQGVDPDVRTPNLDRLAADGVRFTRGYVSAPQCVPSRAGLITGRYQQRFGVEDNLKGPLPLAETTIAERLRDAGYVTGMVGKWHLDVQGRGAGARDQRLSRDHMPHAHGFQEYWRGERGQYHASHDLQGKPLAGAPAVVPDGRFRITVQTEAALGFLNRRETEARRPWLLYLSWFAPHVPLESPEPWLSRTPATLPLERRQALAMIAAMDEGLGRIRERLRAMGQERNTLIWFVGDNGAPTKAGAWNGSLNRPLVGEKGMLTDGGLRVPFLAAWPGTLPAGTVYDRPVINLDVAATAVAAAGLRRDPALDGSDLLPHLTGKTAGPPHEALFWRWRSQAAVLEFPWKLIRVGEQRYLFDVTQPDGEKRNLFEAQPERAARLEARLKAWSDTLSPPGLPTEVVEQDRRFFDEHVHGKAEPKVAPPAEAFQGWAARNGVLEVKDGVLRLLPDKNARGPLFLTRAMLDLAGPVTLRLRARARRGGPSSVTWRERGQQDFAPANVAAFDWPPGPDWTDIEVRIPTQARVIHLRLLPGRACEDVEIRSIEVQGRPPGER